MKPVLKLLSIVVCFWFVSTGCRKSRKNDFFTFKYEIITTKPIAAPTPLVGGNAGLQGAFNSDAFMPGTSYWTYETSYESSYRPLWLALNGRNLWLNEPAKATLKIYVNGKLKATGETASTIYEGKHVIRTTPIEYYVR